MPPQSATVWAGIGLSMGSTGSSMVTLRAAVALRDEERSRGHHRRAQTRAPPSRPARAPADIAYACCQVAAPRSRNTGIIATAVSAAAPSRARMGRMPEERQRHVERGEDGQGQQRLVEPAARADDGRVPGIDRRHEGSRHDGGRGTRTFGESSVALAQ